MPVDEVVQGGQVGLLEDSRDVHSWFSEDGGSPVKLIRALSVQQPIDDPAAAPMRARLTAAGQELLIIATGLFQGVREDGQVLEIALGLEGPDHVADPAAVCRQPARINGPAP